jgi:phage shock protein PspC (stress-responsive transcriptional regulator)
MSTPYPSPPRRLMRDPNRKLVGGVCSGLAKYLNMDVNLVRILAVVITLFTGIPIVLYLIALFVMPEEGTTPSQPPYVNGPQAYHSGFAGQQHGQQPYGQPAQPPVDQVWGPGGAPWEQPQPARPTGYDTAPAAAEPTRTFPEPFATSSLVDQDPTTSTPAEPSVTQTSSDQPSATESSAGGTDTGTSDTSASTGISDTGTTDTGPSEPGTGSRL